MREHSVIRETFEQNQGVLQLIPVYVPRRFGRAGHRLRRPCPTRDERAVERWITYGNDYFGAKELTIAPGQRAVVQDKVAFGCIIIQGYGPMVILKHFGPNHPEMPR